MGGTTTGQAKGGKVNGEKRRKEAMNDEKNNMIAYRLMDADTDVRTHWPSGLTTRQRLPIG
ncbi:hypothetical protein, partial [Bilophila wadsworthia]|uniref:hypothetical protein n=1 Tax=Bilophila wadsworthia TaxID=35833 RepID=UPI003AB5BB20